MASVPNHVHIGFVSLLAQIAAVIAIFGTIHLLALTNETRAGRAWIALGF